MGITNFPNGVSSWGIPQLGGSLPVKPGSPWWVDSATGSNSTGSELHPFATIDQAVNAAAAGDLIIVKEGHSETISAATSLVLDVDGLTIVGLGSGSRRPRLDFSADVSRIPISADDVVIENIVFMCSVAGIVSGVTVTGADCQLRNCEWNLDATGLEFLQMLDLDTADDVKVLGCRFIAENIAGCNTAIRIDASPRVEIGYNVFQGDYTTCVIDGVTGTAAVSNDVNIHHNIIENKDSTAGACLDLGDAETGIVSDNRCFTAFVTNLTGPWDPGNALCCENFLVNDVDETGAKVPATASG